jgi:hypothetical protein
MFRKFTIALTAAAALGAAALVPTAASAGGGGGGWHGHHGHHGWHGGRGFRVGFYGPTFASGGDCYYVRKVVYTSHGKVYRRVLVCN